VFAKGFFAAFVEAVLPVIIGVEAVKPTELLKRYLSGDLPFGTKETKKHEFPDAMALGSLEAWARDAKTIMLVVSGDVGWREFCDKSEHIVCMDALPAALNFFNEDAGVIVKRVLAKLAADKAEELHDQIDAILESYLEDIDLDIDAVSSAHYEIDYVEPSVSGWRIYDPDHADVMPT
jgi:hypothetical protein